MSTEFYPLREELEDWIASLWKDAENTKYKAEDWDFVPHVLSVYPFQAFGSDKFVKFTADGKDDFFAYFQPVIKGPAPLLVHVPGYGAEVSCHTELVAQGYNVLHIEPLGYTGPEGKDTSKMVEGIFWPVLPDTITTKAKGGYRTWLLDCILAIDWALKQPSVLTDRISFFGTSQGGGGSLLLGSLFKDRNVRCVAAEQPFLTNFPLADFRGAYGIAKPAFDKMDDKKAAWKALGYIDTISHAYRLECPVLLTSGTIDEVCPPDTIETLYSKLPGTKSYTSFDGMNHGYNREFLKLASAWFGIYA